MRWDGSYQLGWLKDRGQFVEVMEINAVKLDGSEGYLQEDLLDFLMQLVGHFGNRFLD